MADKQKPLISKEDMDSISQDPDIVRKRKEILLTLPLADKTVLPFLLRRYPEFAVMVDKLVHKDKAIDLPSLDDLIVESFHPGMPGERSYRCDLEILNTLYDIWALEVNQDFKLDEDLYRFIEYFIIRQRRGKGVRKVRVMQIILPLNEKRDPVGKGWPFYRFFIAMDGKFHHPASFELKDIDSGEALSGYGELIVINPAYRDENGELGEAGKFVKDLKNANTEKMHFIGLANLLKSIRKGGGNMTFDEQVKEAFTEIRRLNAVVEVQGAKLAAAEKKAEESDRKAILALHKAGISIEAISSNLELDQDYVRSVITKNQA